MGDEFFFTITETFWPDRSDVGHPLTFTTEPPVMASCIKATGSHWARPTGPDSCELVWSLEVAVRVLGVGGIVERGVRDASSEAYAHTPPRVLQYLALHPCDVEAQTAAARRSVAARSRWRAALMAVQFVTWTAGFSREISRDLATTTADAAAAAHAADAADAADAANAEAVVVEVGEVAAAGPALQPCASPTRSRGWVHRIKAGASSVRQSRSGSLRRQSPRTSLEPQP